MDTDGFDDGWSDGAKLGATDFDGLPEGARLGEG